MNISKYTVLIVFGLTLFLSSCDSNVPAFEYFSLAVMTTGPNTAQANQPPRANSAPYFNYTFGSDKIVIKSGFYTNLRSEMVPSYIIVNNGKDIEITYRDTSNLPAADPNFRKFWDMTHEIKIVKNGVGIGNKINVKRNLMFNPTNPMPGQVDTTFNDIIKK
jgi:hypothetical protein